jgi:tRNA dimethylallyltransferase
LVIAGATASGKTDLAIRLALHFHTEIISADSRQFYRELNIGTAKPDQEQLNLVRHHFINNRNVEELYGAGHFQRDVIALTEERFREHDLLIMTGGSGLYINAVLNGVDEFSETSPEVREQVNQQFADNGLAWLQEQVRTDDPAYFRQVDINNPQRLLRALEVIRLTGEPYSKFLSKANTQRNFIPLLILLDVPREELYRRINERVDRMMQQGLLEEVRQLTAYKSSNALKTVGYKELFDHLEGKTTSEQAITLIKQHTRNYAKRQLTWFRNQGNYTVFSPDDFNGILAFIKNGMR